MERWERFEDDKVYNVYPPYKDEFGDTKFMVIEVNHEGNKGQGKPIFTGKWDDCMEFNVEAYAEED